MSGTDPYEEFRKARRAEDEIEFNQDRLGNQIAHLKSKQAAARRAGDNLLVESLEAEVNELRDRISELRRRQ